MEIIGLDLHKRKSQRSIKADDGSITDRRIATSRERFTMLLANVFLLRWDYDRFRSRLFAPTQRPERSASFPPPRVEGLKVWAMCLVASRR